MVTMETIADWWEFDGENMSAAMQSEIRIIDSDKTKIKNPRDKFERVEKIKVEERTFRRVGSSTNPPSTLEKSIERSKFVSVRWGDWESPPLSNDEIEREAERRGAEFSDSARSGEFKGEGEKFIENRTN